MRKLKTAIAAALILAFVFVPVCAEGNFFTTLIVGSAREGSLYSDALAMMIMSYDWDSNGIRLLVLDRGALFEGVSIDKAISLGGKDEVIRAVNGLYDLSISNIVVLDMSNIPSIVASVGGVEMDINDEDAAQIGIQPGKTLMNEELIRKYLAINLRPDAKGEANSRRNDVFEAIIAKGSAGGIGLSFDLAWTGLGMIDTNIGFFDVVSLGTSALSGGLGGIKRQSVPLEGEGEQSDLIKEFLYAK